MLDNVSHQGKKTQIFLTVVIIMIIIILILIYHISRMSYQLTKQIRYTQYINKYDKEFLLLTYSSKGEQLLLLLAIIVLGEFIYYVYLICLIPDNNSYKNPVMKLLWSIKCIAK